MRPPPTLLQAHATTKRVVPTHSDTNKAAHEFIPRSIWLIVWGDNRRTFQKHLLRIFPTNVFNDVNCESVGIDVAHKARSAAVACLQLAQDSASLLRLLQFIQPHHLLL
jgi:hypothetical protein